MRNLSCQRLRIVVLGYIVRGPLGGLAWHHVQYVTGLVRLGHEVWFVEDSDDYPSCYDPQRDITDTDPSYGLRFAADVFGRVGLEDRWAYYDSHTARWLGPGGHKMATSCRSADLLLNLSGVNPVRPWVEKVPARALIDTDPAFTQARHLTDPNAMRLAQAHNVFFTFGENVGQIGCRIPDDGLPWQSTRQPIMLDAWRVTPGRPDAPFTTVMQWDSYARQEFGDQHFGMKSESFLPYLNLPGKVRERLELALGGTSAPRSDLSARGWTLRNPLEVTRDPWTYQDYIRNSKGEFGVAKHGYVVSNSGWFSERSAAYLASGRPVLVQDTGFDRCMSTAGGVLPFSTPDEACAALEEVAAHYEHHCRAAREAAQTWFDSDRILEQLIERSFSVGEREAVR